ncbi:MAG TPA: aldehyde dehydrogenase family protein [Lacibacter sp.]|nr:aldehyde dehydrogenase family protein [Lacibacter sp.]HMO87683.1 aldehyde dehydrogenase family protein [Lacibacter sp.]HMP87930.1 aldehyde dehydrogenase family protein [Lacibacter sp.]
MARSISKKAASSNSGTTPESRLEVLKTYKIYIGGQFPRTESGRYYVPVNAKGKKLANVCLSSRKDFRDAVEAARNAFGGWSGRAAFNRGQILYRMAEMLEGRKAQFVEELQLQDASRSQAEKEVNLAIDRLIYYAGWCDKYQQLFGSVNPVASSHFNFSVPEPTGVVAIIAPQETSLLGLVSVMAPVIAGGNTCIVLGSYNKPLCSVTFSEVLNCSDLPGGVVNILTGKVSELAPWMADHMDVNALVHAEHDAATLKLLQEKAAANVKRVFNYSEVSWAGNEGQSPYFILDTQEIKTTWHPIENIGGGGSKY